MLDKFLKRPAKEVPKNNDQMDIETPEQPHMIPWVEK